MRRTAVIVSTIALVATSLVVIAPASPASGAKGGTKAGRCDTRVNSTIAKITECVTLDGVKQHLTALQEIADTNGGTRAMGTSGGDASADYAANVLENAGYEVRRQTFSLVFSERYGPTTLEQVAPNAVTYVEYTDFDILEFNAAGEVTAAVTPVDLNLGVVANTNSGCEASDFAGFPAGNIALVRRGWCPFEWKAENAAAAGASAVVVMNEGNTDGPDRQDSYTGSLTAGYTGGIPVVTTSYPLGVEFANTNGLVLHLDVDAGTRTEFVDNILAESRFGNDSNVVMVGGHLDSTGGPGINENGSGVAAILETAEQMARVENVNTVRFALWGGPPGALSYLQQTSNEEFFSIAMYLNFDTIASPNYARFVLDGDGSGSNVAAPASGRVIENFFTNFYSGRGLVSERTSILMASDHALFYQNGIPVGGITTGDSAIKTPAQAAAYGGTAGEAFDPCFRQACDTIANVNNQVLDVNADAVAASTLKYAMSTKGVNGVPGKGNFESPATDDEADVS